MSHQSEIAELHAMYRRLIRRMDHLEGRTANDPVLANQARLIQEHVERIPALWGARVSVNEEFNIIEVNCNGCK